MKVYVLKHPEIPKELDKAKEYDGRRVCIIDNRSVMVIVGVGEEDASCTVFRIRRIRPFLCAIL